MNKVMDFRMWGERGLVATFFMDLCQSDPVVMRDFLDMAHHPGSPVKDAGDLERVACMIEPDFGNKGFGRPDAILRFDCTIRRFVVIVEAKLTGFEEACWSSSRRGEPTFNSRLNGQLELDYRLAMALAGFEDGMSALKEPNWIPHSPYGTAQSLKKSSVLKTLVGEFSGRDLRLDDYYYLVMTTDEQNPFDRANSEHLPQLFKGEFEGNRLVFPDRWQELRSRFGWTNYRAMAGLIRKIEERLPIGSLFLLTYATYEVNKGVFTPTDEGDVDKHPPKNVIDAGGIGKVPPYEKIGLEPPLKGGWVVKYKGDLCHLSCQGYSYAIRYLRRGSWPVLERVKKSTNPEEDKRKMLSMLARIDVIEKDSTTIEDISYWEKRFSELKD